MLYQETQQPLEKKQAPCDFCGRVLVSTHTLCPMCYVAPLGLISCSLSTKDAAQRSCHTSGPCKRQLCHCFCCSTRTVNRMFRTLLFLVSRVSFSTHFRLLSSDILSLDYQTVHSAAQLGLLSEIEIGDLPPPRSPFPAVPCLLPPSPPE